MNKCKNNRVVLRIAWTLAVKFVLVITLLGTTVVVYADSGYFWGYLPNGDTVWLWCSPSGNYWTRCDTGSCPPGESCPCYRCDTSDCQATADHQCGLLAN